MKKYFMVCCLGIALASCELEDPTEGVPTTSIVQLEHNKTSVLANGEDQVILTATLGNLTEANRLVQFASTNGKILGSADASPKSFELKASNRTATAILQAGNVADNTVQISAEVEGFKDIKTIVFERAYPDVILLTPEKYVINKDRIDFTNLSVQLFRDIGVPSFETKISFQVTELDAASVELVPFVFSDNNATASVSVKSKNGEPGFVSIKAVSRNQAGDEISSNVIEVEIQ